MIQKKYAVNLFAEFETGEDEYREVICTIYLDHKPNKREINVLLEKHKCNYAHIGKYYKKS